MQCCQLVSWFELYVQCIFPLIIYISYILKYTFPWNFCVSIFASIFNNVFHYKGNSMVQWIIFCKLSFWTTVLCFTMRAFQISHYLKFSCLYVCSKKRRKRRGGEMLVWVQKTPHVAEKEQTSLWKHVWLESTVPLSQKELTCLREGAGEGAKKDELNPRVRCAFGNVF